MTFAAPWWLLVGSVVVVAGWLALRRADRRRRRDLESFAASGVVADLTVSLSQTRRRTKRALVLAGVGLCFLALAGPERGFDWERTERRGIDVLVAVDVSRSMLAQDIQPDRLRRAKLAVDDLMRRLGGDRLGLIAFAGTAFLQCPLTLDHAAFQRSLEALEPGIISAPGSNLASALDAARKALASEAKNVKLLVLFSDGEDLGGNAITAAERAAADGIRVFTVGVGTPAGELIPLASDEGPAGFVKDPSGRIVKSRLDEATLRRVAEITDGFYVPLGARAEGVEEIAERALAPIPREELASRLRRVPRNRYQWPLVIAVLLLVAEPFLGERARGSALAAPARTTARAAVSAVSAVLLAAAASGAYAASSEDAERLYHEKDYRSAAEQYRALAEREDDPRLDLNLGTASYRAGAFGEAAEAFARALRSGEDALRERAFYDLGNAQYRLGEDAVASNPQNAVSAWEQAIAAYEEAIGLDGGDDDARFNRDFVKKKLEELRQQMQQKPPEQDSQSQSDSPKPQDRENRDHKDESGRQPNQAPPQESDQTPPSSDRTQGGGSDGESKKNREHPPPPAEPKEKRADSSPNDGRRGDEPKSSGSDADSSAQARAGHTNPPGTLSEEEARELLDSLRDEEAVMPVAPLGSSAPPETDDARDW